MANLSHDFSTSFSELYKNCKQLNNLAFYENHLIEEEVDINSMTGLTIKSEYLTEKEFRLNFGKIDTAKIIKKGLDILHLNCRSLRSNYDHIPCDLVSNLNIKFDIIAMSETWFEKKDELERCRV